MWTCPSCHQPLQHSQTTWRCDNGHVFDKAKEGYVNLLLAQHKNSKEPGDNKAMVNARRGFLDAGYYQPLADAISKIIEHQFEHQTSITVFDAGCGEGYYLSHVFSHLSELFECHAQGIDISKNAVQKAAKRNTYCQFSVASSYALPILENSQDVVLQVFAPSDPNQIIKVLKPGGIWLKVDPGPAHLMQLKALVYKSSNAHTAANDVQDGLASLHTQKVSFDFNIDNAQHRQNLLMMTPFYWSTSEAGKARIVQSLTQVTADFSIQVLQKIEGETGCE